MKKFMTSMHGMLRVAAVVIVAAAVAVAAKTEPQQDAPQNLLAPLSDAYFLGGHLSYNVRNGYRKFDGIDQRQAVDCYNLFMSALSGGKRFALDNQQLRLQAMLEVAWGEAPAQDEHYVELVSGGFIPATIYTRYIITSLQADVHRLFPVYMRTYFLSGGLSLHLTTLTDILKESYTREELITGDNYFTFSPSINIGAGMENKVSRNMAVSTSYNMRFMMATSFTETGRPAGQPVVGTTFPMGVKYTEFFFAHAVQVHILFLKQRTVIE